ncbi:MAG: hypothetical protein C0487_06480 [Leptothrix sp. (in: Bacteria)]|nr:hypothetical protein [Leptothrix sp. (in: b-proteobacteria)]
MSKPWFIHRLVGIALLALLTSAHAEIEREWPDAGLQITTDQAVLRASDGQIIVPAGRYESIRPLGSVALVSRQERHGLINALGRPVTPLRYSYIERILRRGAHAWFAVSVEGPSGSLRAGIIDETGRTLVEPAWESIDLLQRPQDDDAAGDPPSQALFKIQRGGRIGAVNLAGRITIAPQFSHMAQLSGQGTMVLLEQGSRQALCDAATGACPFALGQQRLQPLVPDRADDQLLLVGQPGKLGLFDLHGHEILPLAYDEIALARPDSGRQPPLAVRKGLQRQWLALKHQDDGRWQASPTAPPRMQVAYYDEHPQARQDRAVVDARYLPVALRTADQIEAALQDGRMQAPLLPSIQLSDRKAYVQFSALTPKNPAQTWPAVMVRCAWPGGFRLLRLEEEDDTNLKQACNADPQGGLRFQRQADEQLTCLNCGDAGLPTQWVSEDPTRATGCDKPVPAWNEQAVRQAYAKWVKLWARQWRPILRGDSLSNDERFDELVAPNSRAFSTLVQLRNDEQSIARSLGLNLAQAPKAALTARLIDWMLKAQPVRSGGLYPESDTRMAALCAEVWYLQLPGVEARLKGPHAADAPLLEPYALPLAGTLQRGTYPFLTFTHGPQGIQLAGLSREMLQMVWWLEGGR